MAKNTNNIYKCDCNVIHEEIVNVVKGKMPSKKTFLALQSFLKYLEIEQE